MQRNTFKEIEPIHTKIKDKDTVITGLTSCGRTGGGMAGSDLADGGRASSGANVRRMCSSREKLRFAVIEEYMILDDSSAYPMDSVRLLHFTGSLSRTWLQAAMDALFERHPLLICKCESDSFHFVWVPADQKPQLIWKNADEETDCLNASGFPVMHKLDLFHESGFRIYVIESQLQNWTKILFQFHHSVSDGLGEMQVIGEFLTQYARFAGLISSDAPLSPVDVTRLSLRRHLGWSLGGYMRNCFHTDFTLRHLAWGRPKPLFRHKPLPKTAPTENYPFLQSLQLTHQETKSYIQKSKSLNVTVNDLLLRDFYLTIDSWRVRNGRDFPVGVSRLMVPMSLRKPCHDGMPAANIVSSIFLDRNKKQISGDPQRLLEGIHREMEWAKAHDQKYVFPMVLSALESVPGLLKLFLNSGKCRSTGVLSNLGRVLEIAPVPRNEAGKIQLGESLLEYVDAAPPIRPQTLISFSALTYAGALRLCLRYDQHFLSPNDAEQFLEIFHEKLTQA